MKIDQFDKTNLRFLSADIQQALVVVGAKYGISLTYKGARYESTSATLKSGGTNHQKVINATNAT